MAQTSSTPALDTASAREAGGNLARLANTASDAYEMGAELLPVVYEVFLDAAGNVREVLRTLNALGAGVTVKGAVSVSGAVTANAGAGLSTTGLALEQGQLARLASAVSDAWEVGATVLPIVYEAALRAVDDIDNLARAQAGVATAALSNISGSATSVQLLVTNAARRMATFFNDSSASLYLKLGASASTTSYTVLIQPYAYYELPLPVYTGRIDGLWSTAAGTVRITEM